MAKNWALKKKVKKTLARFHFPDILSFEFFVKPKSSGWKGRSGAE